MGFKQFISKYGLLLGVTLAAIDIWRSYFSPLQHQYFNESQGNKYTRDIWYISSILMSVLFFIFSIIINNLSVNVLIFTIAFYRSTDILVSIFRIAISGQFGNTPNYCLERNKIMRNILATLVNYVEFVFWYSSIYFILGTYDISQFSTQITSPLSFVLSFTTLTTIGYGNIAPQEFKSAFFCSMEALSSIVILSIVIGSLSGLANSPSPASVFNEQKNELSLTPLSEPTKLSPNNALWIIHRAIGFVIFFLMSLCFLFA